ncbi:ceramidase domain-containing protein [Shimia aestuarii]|uniref:Ceramidase n=1 Tax=Shimia aestuarii TaxID=254406 RepID=A0A1I4J5K8_9RHOB|nr:ceramidase domain-containing protein [Shimia aestuarii]SFL61366.1 Ceramidase [Shimia aestuarii]
MDWTRAVDGYCERADPGYWAEPVNAVTNAAFLIAALIMWRRVQGAGMGAARLLCGVLAVIGIGSYLFHTHAQVWAGVADVLPIAVYVLIYITLANRAYWGMRWPLALGTTALFFPYAALTVPLFRQLPFLDVSAGYWPIPLLIAAYALLLRHRLPDVARGLAIGSSLLALSLTFRSLDDTLCGAIPIGTHFLWHILNAVMLGWMIEVYRRHVIRVR